MNKWKEASVIFLLVQIFCVDVIDANSFGDFGDRIKPKSLKRIESENDDLFSSFEGDSPQSSPRESRGVISTDFKAFEREKLAHLSAESKNEGAKPPVESNTQDSPKESTTVPTTTTVVLSGGNGAHPTPSLLSKRLQRNRTRLPTRLTVPPANLKKKNTESETESDVHEISSGQPTWKHLIHTMKPFESHLWLKDNKRKQSDESAKEDTTSGNISEKETISNTSNEEKMSRVKNPVSNNCTGSESDYCKDDDATTSISNQNKRRQFHGTEGRLPLNFRRNLKPKTGPIRLRVQPVLDQSRDSNPPSGINEREQPSRELSSISPKVLVPESAGGERANRHTISRSSTESLTMTSRPALRDHGTPRDLNIDKGSPPPSKSIHLDTSSFVTTAGPLASHRLEDWLVSTTDTGWMHPKITTDRSEEQKTYGPFTLPAAPSPQTITESGVSADPSSRKSSTKQVLKSGAQRQQQSAEKLSSAVPQVVGFSQVGHPKLSEYFHERKHAPKSHDSPPPDNNTDMHIYRATKDIIEQAQLEERRKALFSTVRSSPVRQRIVNDSPGVPTAREIDAVSNNTGGIRLALRSHSSQGTRNSGSPLHKHQHSIPNTKTIISAEASTNTRESVTVAQMPGQSDESNNSTDFVRGYLMDRESPFTKISSGEEFQGSPTQSQEIRVSSPPLQRKRVVYPNQIFASNEKVRNTGEPEIQDRPPPPFEPYSDFLKGHGMTDEIFGGGFHSNPQHNFGSIQDKRVSNEVSLDHNFSREKHSNKDSITFNVHPSPPRQNPLTQKQQNPNDQLKHFSHSEVSSTIWGNTDHDHLVHLPQDIARTQEPKRAELSGGVPIAGGQLSQITPDPHQSHRFRSPNDNGRHENRHGIDQSTARSVGDQTKFDNHRPLPQPLPTFSKEQEGKDDFIRSSFVFFSPPASVSSKSPVVPSQNEFEKNLQSIFSSNHNLPDPLHAASQENQIVANEKDKFRTFNNAPQLLSINPIPPPFYPQTEPSADITPPALIHSPTPPPLLHFPSNTVSFSGEHLADGSPGNKLHGKDISFSHLSEVHQKEPQFVSNNNFHGLINFELHKGKGNSPHSQGNSNFQSFNEIKGSIPNLEQNSFTAEPFLGARHHPNIPHLHPENGHFRHTSTSSHPRDSTEQGSEFHPHSKEIGNDIPTSFASFEVEQFLGHHDHFGSHSPTSSPILDIEENSHNRHRTNNNVRHSNEEHAINSNESLLPLSQENQHLHFSEENRRPHFPPDSRESEANQDNRRPHFPPDSREPELNNDNRRPHFSPDGREPELNHDNRRPHFSPDSREPELNHDNRRPNFPPDSREPELNHDNRRPNFPPDSREPELNHDNRRPNFITDSRPQFINDNRRPEFVLDNRRPQFNQNTRRPQFNHENRRPNFIQENRRPSVGQGSRRPQIIQESRRPKFNQNGRPVQGSFSSEIFNQLDLGNRKRPGIIIAQSPGHRHNFPTSSPTNPGFLRPPPEHLRPPPNLIRNVENSKLNGNQVTNSGDENFSDSTRGQNINHINSEFRTTESPAQNGNFAVISPGKLIFQQHQNVFGKQQETPVSLPPLLIPPPPSSARPLHPPRDHGNALEVTPNQAHFSQQQNQNLRSESNRPPPLSPPSPLPPPPPPPLALNANTHIPHHRLPPPPLHASLLNHIMSPLRPLLPRPSPQAARNIRQNAHHSPNSPGHFHRNPTERPFHQDVDQQNSLKKESVRFPSSHEMENDFTPMREVSQPLPEKSAEQRIRLSESHAKLLENMRYGVDGKPLDVWIPIVGKEEADSHEVSGGGRRPHPGQSHEDNFDSHFYDDDDFDYNLSHEDDFPDHPRHQEDDYDYHIEKEPHFKNKSDKNVQNENSGSRGLTESITTTATTSQPSSPPHTYKGPRYNVINVPNINIVSTVH